MGLSQRWIRECLPSKLPHTPLLNCPFPHLPDKFSCGVKMPFLFCVPLLLLLFPNTISPEQKQGKELLPFNGNRSEKEKSGSSYFSFPTTSLKSFYFNGSGNGGKNSDFLED